MFYWNFVILCLNENMFVFVALVCFEILCSTVDNPGIDAT